MTAWVGVLMGACVCADPGRLGTLRFPCTVDLDCADDFICDPVTKVCAARAGAGGGVGAGGGSAGGASTAGGSAGGGSAGGGSTGGGSAGGGSTGGGAAGAVSTGGGSAGGGSTGGGFGGGASTGGGTAGGISTGGGSAGGLPTGVVRRGSCVLPDGMLSVDCTVSPAQQSTAHTLLVHQATSASGLSSNAETHCALVAASTITCKRQGSAGANTVQWQTAELPSLDVQHLTVPCMAGAMGGFGVTINAVTPSETFFLYSLEQYGTGINQDDVWTVTLGSSTSVSLAFGGATTTCATSVMSLQVVDLAGAAVSAGTAMLAAGSAQVSVTGLGAVNPASTALLYSTRTASISSTACDFILRGDMPDATSAHFHRGDVAGGCSALAASVTFHRIDFGAAAKVQQLTASLAAGVASTQVAITPVDPARTLVFSGAQMVSGQAGGEGSSSVGNVPGDMLASFTLGSSSSVDVVRGSSAVAAQFTFYAVELQ